MDDKKIETFRVGVLTSKGHAEVHEMKLPKLLEHQVLVKQLACNICTADYGQWLGLREHQGYPMAGGHEGAGIILETGDKVVELLPGDFVALSNNYCGECEYCRRGEESQCVIRSSYDLHEGGYKGRMGFADYQVRNATAVVKMNPRLSPSEAAFLEPLATVVKGIGKLRVRPQDTVAVIGAGTMGLLNAQAARSYGARIIVTEMMEKKIKTARDMGFETVDAGKEDPVKKVRQMTGGRGADAVIIAAGASKANEQAAAMLKHFDGRMLMFAAAYPPPELGLSSNDIHYRRMEILGTYLGDTKDFLEAARMLNEGVADVKPLIEASYPLDEIQSAFEEAARPGNYRVSVLLHGKSGEENICSE
ncbi:zinc-dependent alcohol dehydrogenase [Anaerostipes sp.]|uniref:zinc-dependent alcohol dehydrogenase n=1 Tax=Anaerostipes sp. TaxID=1872530 RepID=UPI0025B84DDA|nr:zinc-binding dehydrogenase [Anaerostipes sp.]MBS7007154.1 alcohol dehydrogenase catalytic domain-containing protein [Anaerostipes sp.]